MVTVLRLEGLTYAADSGDIREFFHDLRIPQGAVHIIGGSRGEAFILFSTEKDGQLAMRRSGNILRGSRVTLHISSVAELKQKLTSSLQQDSTKPKDSPEIHPKNSPQQACGEGELLNSSEQQNTTTLMLALLIALKGLESKMETSPQKDPCSSTLLNLQTTQISHSPALSPSLPMTESEKVPKEHLKREASVCNPGYLRLYGLPHSVTKADISHFLHGLCVQEVLVNVRLGDRRGCLVKVASEDEAEMGLQWNGKSLTSTFPVEVRKGTEKLWTHTVLSLRGSPEQGQLVTSISELLLEQKGLCIPTRKRPYSGDQFSEMRKEKREEHYVMIRNLKPNMTKTEIKTLLGCSHLENSKVQHLLDKNLRCTSTAFVAFDRVEDYVSAMNLSGSHFETNILDVSSITKEKMMSQLCSDKKIIAKPKWQQCGLSRTCIYVRNLPAGVSPDQVQDIFHQFPVAKEGITLLRDNMGNCLGEAVVSFGCEDTAQQAQALHRANFMGNELLLTLITPQQLDTMIREQTLND